MMRKKLKVKSWSKVRLYDGEACMCCTNNGCKC